ncbi:MAG: metallophosphoesterase family protein [Chloroflexia bacterium]
MISDIHANLAALDAVLADIGAQAEAIWCLGDVVGYGPDPNECVARLQERGIVSIAGNHDWACLGRLDLADFNPDAREACLWTADRLSKEGRAFLERLPVSRVLEDVTLVHGSPREPIWEYLTSPEVALENLSFFETRICLVGHTHVPMVFHIPEGGAPLCRQRWLQGGEALSLESGRWILNPGAIGQPRDGDPRAAYLLLDTETLEVRIRRVPYAVETTQRRMLEFGLPGSLIRRLAFGW